MSSKNVKIDPVEKEKWIKFIQGKLRLAKEERERDEKIKSAKDERDKKRMSNRAKRDMEYLAVTIAATMHEYAGLRFNPQVMQKTLDAVKNDPTFQSIASDPLKVISYLRTPSTVIEAYKEISDHYLDETKDIAKSIRESGKEHSKEPDAPLTFTEIENDWVVVDFDEEQKPENPSLQAGTNGAGLETNDDFVTDFVDTDDKELKQVKEEIKEEDEKGSVIVETELGDFVDISL
ncbi:MAG: hypothetical protein J6P72_09505 [Firmicutes bacterium]|nr:hypothetical protein [Bacillota bacterium]